MNVDEFRAAMAADKASEAQRRREREARVDAYWDEFGAELEKYPISAYRGRGRGLGATEPTAGDEPRP